MKKEINTKAACCSRGQKIWGVIALAGLFACGLFLGAAWNGGRHENSVYQVQCDALAKKIIDASQGKICNGTSNCLDLLKELNDVYSVNCAGHVPNVDVEHKEQKTAAQVAAQVVMPQQEACEVIEGMLLQQLAAEEDLDPRSHTFNISIYKKLTEYGCPENTEKYQALIQREQNILAALTGQAENSEKTCAEIESLLMQSLPTYDLNNSDIRIERAKIYANLSERGCPENSQSYVGLAAKELEIARALRDDEFSQSETVEVVETYKRLEMKQAATEVLDKVQKLTDPAIDFIIQVQKIIEE